jgi:hypothetical protein
MKTVYIAGPISLGGTLTESEIQNNVQRFGVAELWLKLLGYSTINPINNYGRGNWIACMRADIKQMMDCQAIYLLRGWEASRGSRVEFWLAQQLDFEVMFEASALGELLGEVGMKAGEEEEEI